MDDCRVISETRTTSNKPKETIRQTDNEQYVSHTNHRLRQNHHLRQNFISTQCNLILSCQLLNSSTKPSKLIFQLVLFQLKVEHCY